MLRATPGYHLDLGHSLGCYGSAGGALYQHFKGGAMRYLSHRLSFGILVPLGLLAAGTSATFAADVGPPPPDPVIEAPVVPSWTYRVTPYG
jgi:hypothetical protein